uniref:PolyA polymerase type 3-like n=1 Tax=Rhizophora mucronata TaxID=61149 RepID=A0A2P2MJC6_RHIMU
MDESNVLAVLTRKTFSLHCTTFWQKWKKSLNCSQFQMPMSLL